ncbi:unnamed protein product [Darwinula stevensoni]|uniref:Uncharacterized protein n=1 Tax=Darwinula stevensoni TaxID=69355 RepID=A0A7R9A6I1_9CRUS|nr:unnamed protein product [Darwinula stevensoni]CAG0894651.1 unnamed protein product [Darwinula stevensoni]
MEFLKWRGGTPLAHALVYGCVLNLWMHHGVCYILLRLLGASRVSLTSCEVKPGLLFIHADIMVETQRYCLRWSNYQSNVISAFSALMKDEDFVDVTLACEGKSLKAHKMLLSACSPYFRELLKGNPCQHPILILCDMKFSHLQSILHFVYHGEVDVSQDDLGDFLKTADVLHIKGLAEERSAAGNKTVELKGILPGKGLSSHRSFPASTSFTPVTPSSSTHTAAPHDSSQPSTPRSLDSNNTNDSDRPLEIVDYSCEISPKKEGGEESDSEAGSSRMDCDGGGTALNVGYNTPMNLSRDMSNLFNSNSNSGGASAYSPLAAAAGIPPTTPTGAHPVSLMPFQGLLTPGSEPGSASGRSPSSFHPSGRRPRTVFDQHQLMTLKTYYKYNTNPNSSEITRLAQGLGLDRRVIKVWFQNKRTREREKSLSVFPPLPQDQSIVEGVWFQNERAKHRKLAMWRASTGDDSTSTAPTSSSNKVSGNDAGSSGDDGTVEPKIEFSCGASYSSESKAWVQNKAILTQNEEKLRPQQPVIERSWYRNEQAEHQKSVWPSSGSQEASSTSETGVSDTKPDEGQGESHSEMDSKVNSYPQSSYGAKERDQDESST